MRFTGGIVPIEDLLTVSNTYGLGLLCLCDNDWGFYDVGLMFFCWFIHAGVVTK